MLARSWPCCQGGRGGCHPCPWQCHPTHSHSSGCVSVGMALPWAHGSSGMGRAELLFQHLPQPPASSQGHPCPLQPSADSQTIFQAQEQLSRLPCPWRLQKPAKPLWHQEQSHARAPCSLDLICFNFVLIWVVFSLGCSFFFFSLLLQQKRFRKFQ